MPGDPLGPAEVESPTGSVRAPEPGEVGDTDSLSPEQRVRPSWDESLARHAAAPIGGPLGEHAVVGRHWFWTPLRVGLLLALVALALGWFGKAACVQQFDPGNGQLSLDWRSSRPYVAMCYSDIVPLYGAERLDQDGTFPYKTSWIDDEGKPTAHVRYMEYPVMTGIFQWVNAKLTQGWIGQSWLPTGLPVVIYFSITAFWLALAWLITIWATGRTARHRPWDVAFVALSPLIMVHAFTNFDTLATACAAGGLLAWSRKRPLLAGVLLGLGVATKLYPVFLLGPMLILCLRTGKMRQWWQAAATTAVTWLVCNLWLMLLFPDGWREFFRLNTTRGADPDSLYNVIMQFTGWEGFDGQLAFGQTPEVLNTVSAVLFIVCCVVIAFIGLHAPVRPRLAQLCFLVIAAFLVTNKVWSPQYSIWLVPLAILALPRWKLLLAWMMIDALVWVPRMMFYLGEDHKGLPQEWFLGMVVLRDLAVLGLCALIIYEIYHPAVDRVRRHLTDDPGGGVFEDVPDRFVLGRRRTPAPVEQAPESEQPVGAASS